MKRGNWVPISKGFVSALPKDRPYTELEAAYSVSCDIAAGKKVSVAGYAKLWKWNPKKVRRWMRDTGWIIRQDKPRHKNPVQIVRATTGGAIIHDPNWIDDGSTVGTTTGQPRVQPRDNLKIVKSRSNEANGTTTGQPRVQPRVNRGVTTINQSNPSNQKGRKEEPEEEKLKEGNPFM